VAASVLRHWGIEDVSDLMGGYGAWAGAGLPVEGPGATTRPAPAPEVEPAAADDLAAAGALLLDVREADEWHTGHAPRSTWLPMGQVLERASELPRQERIVVVCRSGGRSAAVAEALRHQGLDAVNLAGGLRAWTGAGLPLVTESGEPGAVL
jgi:rhodanese-related sulfurtransferase